MSDRDLSSLSHIDPTRLSQIWPGTAEAGPAADPGDALRRQLAVRLADLPQLPGAAEDAPDAAAPAGAVPAGPDTVGQLLADPAPLATALRRVKEWAKPAMARDDPGLPREAAGVLYYAAIAAARARAGVWITDLPVDRVRQGARWALGRPWLDEAFAALFREGLAALDGPPGR